jgi:hypothetical protein
MHNRHQVSDIQNLSNKKSISRLGKHFSLSSKMEGLGVLRTELEKGKATLLLALQLDNQFVLSQTDFGTVV